MISQDDDTFYDGYECWKGWDSPFSFSEDDADYYTVECRDARIAGADILEIGFGQGNFLAWARARGANVTGTEINPVLCERARAEGVELLPPALDAVAADNAERFDTIVAFDVFEHFGLDEIAVQLQSIQTMLRPGGHVILRFPNGQSPFGLAPQHGDPTHKTALSLAKLEPLLRRLDFEVVRYDAAFQPPGRRLTQRLVRTTRRMLRASLASVLNFIYGQSIPWDPVVTLVLRKTSKYKETS